MKKTSFFLHALTLAALASASTAMAQDDSTSSNPAAESTSAMSAIPESNSSPDIREFQEQVALPTSARLEYLEDPSNPKPLFPEEQLRKILSDKPRFIYYPEGVDPMLIPWTREKVMAQEIFTAAQVAEANKDYQKAIDLYTQVLEQFPNTVEGQRAPEAVDMARQKKAEIDGIASGVTPVLTGPSNGGTEPIVLPDWVKKNTTAIMLGPTPVVLVENDFLREGDFVPKFAGVRVKSISDAEVVFEYQDQSFPVQVSGNPEGI